MSFQAMTMGTLTNDPVRRTSSAGKPFTTATMRVPVDGGEAFLASLIASSTSAADAPAEHRSGDTIVCDGRAELKSWTDRQGDEAHVPIRLAREKVQTEVEARIQLAQSLKGNDRAGSTGRRWNLAPAAGSPMQKKVPASRSIGEAG